MYCAQSLAVLALLWGACAAGQGNVSEFGGATPIHPERWFGIHDYPEAALAQRRSGVVRFAFDINRKGRVENCVVTLSSGSKDLDELSCHLVAKRGRFKPAKDEQGNPIATRGQWTTSWNLPY